MPAEDFAESVKRLPSLFERELENFTKIAEEHTREQIWSEIDERQIAEEDAAVASKLPRPRGEISAPTYEPKDRSRILQDGLKAWRSEISSCVTEWHSKAFKVYKANAPKPHLRSDELIRGSLTKFLGFELPIKYGECVRFELSHASAEYKTVTRRSRIYEFIHEVCGCGCTTVYPQKCKAFRAPWWVRGETGAMLGLAPMPGPSNGDYDELMTSEETNSFIFRTAWDFCDAIEEKLQELEAEGLFDSASRPGIDSASAIQPGKSMLSWHDLEARFRALQPIIPEDRSAQWLSTTVEKKGKANEAQEKWFFGGWKDERALQVFKWTAERAALMLGHRGGPTAVPFWLDLLRRESKNYRPLSSGNAIFRKLEKLEDGKPKAGRIIAKTRDESGIIDRVWEASADYCVKVENESLAKAVSRRESIANAQHRSATRVNDVPGEAQSANKAARTEEPIPMLTFTRTKNGAIIAEQPFSDEALLNTYEATWPALTNVRAVVLQKNGKITPSELKNQFRSTILYRLADDQDWQNFVEIFAEAKKATDAPTKGTAYALLEKKTGMLRSSIRSTCSRARNPKS